MIVCGFILGVIKKAVSFYKLVKQRLDFLSLLEDNYDKYE